MVFRLSLKNFLGLSCIFHTKFFSYFLHACFDYTIFWQMCEIHTLLLFSMNNFSCISWIIEIELKWTLPSIHWIIYNNFSFQILPIFIFCFRRYFSLENMICGEKETDDWCFVWKDNIVLFMTTHKFSQTLIRGEQISVRVDSVWFLIQTNLNQTQFSVNHNRPNVNFQPFLTETLV